MAQITEDYVSFETAKLLKEKGFDAEGVSEFGGFYVDYYHNGQDIGIATESMMLNKTLSYWEYLRPTLQMAMKWLREVHKIHIAIYPYGDYSCDNYQFDVYKDGNFVASKDDGYMTYEQAAEAAIKFCLENLI